MSSSIVKSPPALHLGSTGDIGVPFWAACASLACSADAWPGPVGGAGGAALGAIYVVLGCCCGGGGRVGVRLARSSPRGSVFRGADMGLPCSVGMVPASDEEVDDGDVSALEDELIELMLFAGIRVPISFRGIALVAPACSGLGTGVASFDSTEVRASPSRDFTSCGGWGVVRSDAVGGFGGSDLGAPSGGSLRGGNADRPTGLLRDVLSPDVLSDGELVFEDPALLPLGASASLNFSPDTWLVVVGDLICCIRSGCTRSSSASFFAAGRPRGGALRGASFIGASSVDGCLPLSWNAMWGEGPFPSLVLVLFPAAFAMRPLIWSLSEILFSLFRFAGSGLESDGARDTLFEGAGLGSNAKGMK